VRLVQRNVLRVTRMVIAWVRFVVRVIIMIIKRWIVFVYLIQVNRFSKQEKKF
jgi:large-conductance mechanosensitive channel